MEKLSEKELNNLSVEQLKKYNEEQRAIISEITKPIDINPEPSMTCSLDVDLLSDTDVEDFENIIQNKSFEVVFNVRKYNRVKCEYEFMKQKSIVVKKV